MGSHFFKAPVPKFGSGSNPGLSARAIGASAFLGRNAAFGANKDIAAASAIGHDHDPLTKSTGSSAYPKGPKK